MRGSIGFVLGIALAAMVAGGASGKAPPDGIELCGADACRSIPAGQAELFVIRALHGSASEPAPPGPFFVVRWQWPERPEQRAWWIPKGGIVRDAGGVWRSQSVASEAMLRSAAAGMRPFPAPTLSRVVVGRKIAENPQSYLRLLRAGELTTTFDGARGWIEVRLASLDPSPWTNGASWLRISRRGGWVWRDVRIYRTPPALAERVRQGLSLTPFARPG